MEDDNGYVQRLHKTSACMATENDIPRAWWEEGTLQSHSSLRASHSTLVDVSTIVILSAFIFLFSFNHAKHRKSQNTRSSFHLFKWF